MRETESEQREISYALEEIKMGPHVTVLKAHVRQSSQGELTIWINTFGSREHTGPEPALLPWPSPSARFPALRFPPPRSPRPCLLRLREVLPNRKPDHC